MSNERRGCNPFYWPQELVLYIRSLRNPPDVITKADLADDEEFCRLLPVYREQLIKEVDIVKVTPTYGHGLGVLDALDNTNRLVERNTVNKDNNS